MERLLMHKRDQWYVISSVVFLVLAAGLSFLAWSVGIRPENIPLSHFLILILAAFRLIRLFTYDSVTAFIRDYLKQFSTGPREILSNLINCPWCTGVWTALLVSYIYLLIPGGIIFLGILALAGVASYLQIIIWKIGREK
ncbi:MAG: DUF1360 domain-containing protein [Candidatus Pacebacteria bacterium]|nr:DUF1360 domain-containing protein [Candidatus Paceibacterota bacterium]MDR3583049.1 DUF1360 domain-containing protein [Candidatus Paceibacterota bacterium]